MGRELRRVPADWQHPRTPEGSYQPPLHDEDIETAGARWWDGKLAWERRDLQWFENHDGVVPNPKDFDKHTWLGWEGEPPDPTYYRPAWDEESRTHFQMYENTSEGTPISPVMPDIESLAHWLADNGASAFGSMTATYEQWLTMCQRGWAPSVILSARGLESGVEADL